MRACNNVGLIDRCVRLVLGLAGVGVGVGALGVLEGAPLGIAVAIVGIVLMGTAALGFCPLYVPFNFSTCNTRPGPSGRSL